LETAFHKRKGKATTVMSPELLYSILTLALQLLDGADMGPWARHVGKGVSHHHGWLMWVQRLRLVTAAKPLRRNNPKPLKLGQMGRLFTLAPLDAAMSIRLEQLIRFGTCVRSVLLRPPRTFLCWRECIQALQTGMVESRLITRGQADKSGDKWLCRSLCLFAMARAGIPQLEVLRATSSQKLAPFLEAQRLVELSRWFPDSCNWCDCFEGTVDVATFMTHLGYRGRPELLTMWLCIAGDAHMKAFVSDAGVCTVNGRTISQEAFRKAAFESKKIDGIPPNPLRLLQSLNWKAAS
jgi:hypothetical protein